MNASAEKCTPVIDRFTVAPIEPIESNTCVSPEFIRLPKSGEKCPHCGLARSTLNNLILPCAENDFKPSVKSHLLRQRGRIRGIRLIDYASLCSFIRSHPYSECGTEAA